MPVLAASATLPRRGRSRRTWTRAQTQAYFPHPRQIVLRRRGVGLLVSRTRTCPLRRGPAGLRPGPAWRTWRPRCGRTATCWTRCSAWALPHSQATGAATSACLLQASPPSAPRQAPTPRTSTVAVVRGEGTAGSGRREPRCERCALRARACLRRPPARHSPCPLLRNVRSRSRLLQLLLLLQG